MLGAGQPLPHRDHRLNAGAPRGEGEGDRAVERVGMVGRVEVQPVDPVHRGLNLLYVKHIGDDDFGTQVPKTGAARIVSMHHGACRDALFQQLGGNRAANPSGGAGYQHSRFGHWSFFPC